MLLVERFVAKVTFTDECWLWTGARFSNGYGSFWLLGKSVGAHRVAYELWRGPIPEGLHLDHLCRVRHCVNPDHLEPVTVRENLSRSPVHQMNYTHCVHGHPLSGDNLYLWNGRRKCRECNRRRSRLFQQAKRNA